MPIDDDTDDKIRRNLFSSSALVLLGSWLQLEPMSVLKKLLGEEVGAQVHAWRLWLAIIALLVYFGLRYRFSSAMSEAIEHLRVEREGICFSLVLATLQSELKKYSKSQNNNVAPSFTGPLSSVLSSYGGNATSKLTKLNFEPPIIHERENGSLYVGTASFTADWEDKKMIALHIKAKFQIHQLKRIGIEVKCAARLLFYSKSSTTLLVPAILFVLALSTAAFHLIKAI